MLCRRPLISLPAPSGSFAPVLDLADQKVAEDGDALTVAQFFGVDEIGVIAGAAQFRQDFDQIARFFAHVSGQAADADAALDGPENGVSAVDPQHRPGAYRWIRRRLPKAS